MATCFTRIKLVCADQSEYDTWKAQLQSAVDNQGFIVLEDVPETFTFTIQHEETI